MVTDGINIDEFGTGITPPATKSAEELKAIEDTRIAEAKKADDARIAEEARLAASNGGGTNQVELEGKKYSIDANGNLLNEDKTVFKTKDEYDKIKTSGNSNNTATVVNLDGQDYKLDDKGNALDKDGKVFKTKDELDAIEAESIPLVVELQKASGYIIKDEKGQPKQYEDTPEGLIEWTNDVAIEKAKALHQKFLEQNPEVVAYNEFLQRGGSPEEYFDRKSSSWKDVKLDEKNEAQLLEVIKADLLAAGVDEAQADFTAKAYKDTDKLKEFAKLAHKRLVDYEVNRDKYETEQFQIQEKQRVENNTKYWNSINDTINKGTLQNITIPENERSDFFKFISSDADGKGNTQAMINKAKANPETLLAIEYLFFKGLDLNKLVTNAAKTNQVRTLRSRVAGSQQGLQNGKGVNTGNYTKSNVDDVSLDLIQ